MANSQIVNPEALQDNLMMPQKSLIADENQAPRDDESVTENSPFPGKMANTAQINQLDQVSTAKSQGTPFYSCEATPQDTVEVAEEHVSPAPRNPFTAITDAIRETSQRKVNSQYISPSINEINQPDIEKLPTPMAEIENTHQTFNTFTPQPVEANSVEQAPLDEVTITPDNPFLNPAPIEAPRSQRQPTPFPELLGQGSASQGFGSQGKVSNFMSARYSSLGPSPQDNLSLIREESYAINSQTPMMIPEEVMAPTPEIAQKATPGFVMAESPAIIETETNELDRTATPVLIPSESPAMIPAENTELAPTTPISIPSVSPAMIHVENTELVQPITPVLIPSESPAMIPTATPVVMQSATPSVIPEIEDTPASATQGFPSQ